MTWASDYSRFVPRSTSPKAVFWYSYVGMFVPSVWLAILGATIASVTLDTDPAKMVSAVFGCIASILVLLLVLHGPIATNILNVYSSALAALSMGVRFSRTALALIVGIAGYAVTVHFIFAPSFAKAFDNWLISLLMWMSPYAGVVLADFFVRRKSQIDIAELYKSPETSIYGDINWSGMIAFFAGTDRHLAVPGWPGARVAGADLDQPSRRRGSELAGGHRRGRRRLSGAQQAPGAGADGAFRSVGRANRARRPDRPRSAWPVHCQWCQ